MPGSCRILKSDSFLLLEGWFKTSTIKQDWSAELVRYVISQGVIYLEVMSDAQRRDVIDRYSLVGIGNEIPLEYKHP